MIKGSFAKKICIITQSYTLFTLHHYWSQCCISVVDFFNVKSIFLNLLVYSSNQILPSPVYDSDTSLVTMIKKKPLKKSIEYTASWEALGVQEIQFANLIS